MQAASNMTASSLLSTKENIVQHTADVYFTHSYAQLYEKKEQGKAQTVYFQSDFGEVEYTFIKREVPYLVEGKQYYDLTTAYGYGGPHIIESTDAERLMQEFNVAFHHYCKRHDIVSEFIRFHLFESEEVRRHFDGKIQKIGHHIARDLKKTLDKDFHKSIGRTVRNAQGKGVTVTFDTTGESLNDFLDIYHQTMDRNDANQFYYFQDDFFEEMHEALEGNFLYAHARVEGKIISSFLTIVSEQYAYGFLGGTLDEYFSFNAPTLLEYETIAWLKERGVANYVMGGGYKDNDGIYKFKKKFDLKGEHPFYIGKRIHDKEVYEQLVDIRAAASRLNSASKFFPLYRA